MIEARRHQLAEAFGCQSQARRDQVQIQAGGVPGRNQFGEIVTRQRLAAGKVQMEDAQRGCFPEDARPNPCGKLGPPRYHFEGVGTIHAVQRAAVGDFRDQRLRCGDHAKRTTLRSIQFLEELRGLFLDGGWVHCGKLRL